MDLSAANVGRKQRAHAVITHFLQERLSAKLDKLGEDDPKRAALIAQYRQEAWLEDAARRVRQIQAVTHALKPIHPDARGSNLYVEPSRLPAHSLVGSHVLGDTFTMDVVGNAAALDVYKFLKLDVDGQTVLSLLLAEDPAMLQALSHDAQQARRWQAAFTGLVQPAEDVLSSHVHAKQVYWLVGDGEDSLDATDDAQYHLLAPLYATSLVHKIYAELQEARYGEANKAAREARRAGKAYDGILKDYPDLAVQKLGGTKPQNVSQLNSERGGSNYLLASLPPLWRSAALRPPLNMVSVFDHMFLREDGIRPTVQAMLRFLQGKPPSNAKTRDRVEVYVGRLIDGLVGLAGNLQQGLPGGWTADSRCRLVMEEQLWLDPGRAETDEIFCQEWLYMDWPAQIGHRFGNWLNQQLRDLLPVGEIEQRHWKTELLTDESVDGWARQLDALRTRAGAPHYVPVRKGAV